MSLLDFIKETAAAGSTGAGAIANTRGSLFGGGVIDAKRARKRQLKLMRRVMNYRVIGEGLGVDLGKTHYTPSDVISKLDAAEKKAKNDKDTVTFGLEDEDGNLVKVYVKAEQAEEFENALANMLAGNDDNDDEENSAAEIAEVLFGLKDKFEIVNVEWPTIEGDEEEEQEVVDDTQPTDGEPSDTGTEDMSADQGEGDLEGLDTGDEAGATDASADQEDVKSALQQVIDLLKADAEAKTAEAKAREAEAKSKEAGYAADAAASKIRQEEEVLDMEAYYKNKADKEKEAKQLAKLAKYKHDVAKDSESSLSMESFEDDNDGESDDEDDDHTITMDELAQLIFRNLRANK